MANSTATSRADLERVREALSRVIDSNPQDSTARLMRASIGRRLHEEYGDKADQDQALADYEAYVQLKSGFAQDRNLPVVLVLIGIARMQKGDTQSAAEAFKGVAAVWPKSADARTARMLLAGMGAEPWARQRHEATNSAAPMS